MENQNKPKEIVELEEQLNKSVFKTCVDIPEENVVVFVTKSHVLISDKRFGQNQLIIPFAEFLKRYDDLKAKLNETSVSD